MILVQPPRLKNKPNGGGRAGLTNGRIITIRLPKKLKLVKGKAAMKSIGESPTYGYGRDKDKPGRFYELGHITAGVENKIAYKACAFPSLPKDVQKAITANVNSAKVIKRSNHIYLKLANKRTNPEQGSKESYIKVYLPYGALKKRFITGKIFNNEGFFKKLFNKGGNKIKGRVISNEKREVIECDLKKQWVYVAQGPSIQEANENDGWEQAERTITQHQVTEEITFTRDPVEVAFRRYG